MGVIRRPPALQPTPHLCGGVGGAFAPALDLATPSVALFLTTTKVARPYQPGDVTEATVLMRTAQMFVANHCILMGHRTSQQMNRRARTLLGTI